MEVSIQLLFLFNGVNVIPSLVYQCFNTASVLIQPTMAYILQLIPRFNTASVLIQQGFEMQLTGLEPVSIQLLFLFN